MYKWFIHVYRARLSLFCLLICSLRHEGLASFSVVSRIFNDSQRFLPLMELNISIPILISFSPWYPNRFVGRLCFLLGRLPSKSLDWNNRVSHSAKSLRINMSRRYLVQSAWISNIKDNTRVLRNLFSTNIKIKCERDRG